MTQPQSSVITFPGKVRDGRLHAPRAPELVALEGQNVSITVSLVAVGAKRPTRKQRGYYFPVVCAGYGEHAGMSRNETHWTFKAALLGRINADNPLSPLCSIRSLTAKEFVDYVDQCLALAGRMGCELPGPDPQWRMRGYLDEWEQAVGKAA